MKISKYHEQAEQLSKAIELAEPIIEKAQTIPDDLKPHLLKHGEEVKNNALHPEPQFAKLASLKYLVNEYFTYWNESEGIDIDLFWSTLYQNGLSFERRDVIRTVLNQGKIKNIHEYDVIIDTIFAAEQIGRISKKQANELSQYLGEFETKAL